MSIKNTPTIRIPFWVSFANKHLVATVNIDVVGNRQLTKEEFKQQLQKAIEQILGVTND